jgi:hypothetical protein
LALSLAAFMVAPTVAAVLYSSFIFASSMVRPQLLLKLNRGNGVRLRGPLRHVNFFAGREGSRRYLSTSISAHHSATVAHRQALNQPPRELLQRKTTFPSRSSPVYLITLFVMSATTLRFAHSSSNSERRFRGICLASLSEFNYGTLGCAGAFYCCYLVGLFGRRNCSALLFGRRNCSALLLVR